jgi:hypothetical protein
LDEGDFWAATAPEDRARLDILAHWPWLKWLLLDTSIWPEGINALMKVAFPLVIATLFLGPQVSVQVNKGAAEKLLCVSRAVDCKRPAGTHGHVLTGVTAITCWSVQPPAVAVACSYMAAGPATSA